MDEKTLRFEVWDDANNRWAEATYPMTGEGTLSCIWKSGDIAATAVLKKEPRPLFRIMTSGRAGGLKNREPLKAD